MSNGIFMRTRQKLRERPPGLIQHVLTVLVFGSLVLLLPRRPPLSRSLRLFPWASILLHGPLDICLDLLPAAPLPPMQKRDTQHMLLQHRGAHAEKQRCATLSETLKSEMFIFIVVSPSLKVDKTSRPRAFPWKVENHP